MMSEIKMPTVAMHETSVRAIVPLKNKGSVVLCGLPGLVIGHDGTPYLDPEHSELTFEYLASEQVVTLYLLMEDFELPPKTKDVLTRDANAAGIELNWLPIVDYGRADDTIETQWKALRGARFDVLSGGKSIAVACLYGAGRSGMMAAAIAAENGIEARKAVRYVRQSFVEAVGSMVQEKWVAAGSYLMD